MNEKNGYVLSRQYHDFAFENPDKATTTHAAIMFWLIELNNRLGWKCKFGVPTINSMEATTIKSYKTFRKCFDDLINWGFVKLHQKATNNHTSNIIELVIFTESNTKSNTNSLTNSIHTHCPTQVQSDYQLSVDINKQETNKTKNNKPETRNAESLTFKELLNNFLVECDLDEELRLLFVDEFNNDLEIIHKYGGDWVEFMIKEKWPLFDELIEHRLFEPAIHDFNSFLEIFPIAFMAKKTEILNQLGKVFPGKNNPMELMEFLKIVVEQEFWEKNIKDKQLKIADIVDLIITNS